ncbi:D-alanyl-D-alanine carboxypeptidase family protein [Candidatus Pelagibacter sp. Uisw_113]|uniref:D-alanyl-D-alanine carboxypeptidase family protein n=1 Tax=Candidatus Pelagibacter sp. Uisw_113 TaxID=3230994 RepID=UPI0039ED784D
MIKSKLITIFLTVLLTVNSNAAIDIKARTAILQDYLSGEILFEKDADKSIYPASMTKIMTAMVAFDLIKSGDLKLNDKFTISEKAWRLSRPANSSMFIMVNDEITVENLLMGIIIVSGNDACVALAEGIAGSEEAFASLMTSKALEIGMTSTNFTNSSGLNDPNNVSTVRDILIMSNYLIRNYPEYYSYFKKSEFTWDRTGSDPITQPNTNSLINKNKFVDGIKTGYLAVEKYSLASSLERNGRRLIAVGSGFKTKGSRSYESNKLLNYGLSQFATIEIAKQNQIFTDLEVWQGKKAIVNAYINQDIYKTLLKSESLNRQKYLKVTVNYKGPLKAPIKKDDVIGKLTIVYKNELVSEHDLFAYEEVKRLNVFSRLIKSINFLIWGDV